MQTNTNQSPPIPLGPQGQQFNQVYQGLPPQQQQAVQQEVSKKIDEDFVKKGSIVIPGDSPSVYANRRNGKEQNPSTSTFSHYFQPVNVDVQTTPSFTDVVNAGGVQYALSEEEKEANRIRAERGLPPKEFNQPDARFSSDVNTSGPTETPPIGTQRNVDSGTQRNTQGPADGSNARHPRPEVAPGVESVPGVLPEQYQYMLDQKRINEERNRSPSNTDMPPALLDSQVSADGDRINLEPQVPPTEVAPAVEQKNMPNLNQQQPPIPGINAPEVKEFKPELTFGGNAFNQEVAVRSAEKNPSFWNKALSGILEDSQLKKALVMGGLTGIVASLAGVGGSNALGFGIAGAVAQYKQNPDKAASMKLVSELGKYVLPSDTNDLMTAITNGDYVSTNNIIARGYKAAQEDQQAHERDKVLLGKQATSQKTVYETEESKMKALLKRDEYVGKIAERRDNSLLAMNNLADIETLQGYKPEELKNTFTRMSNWRPNELKSDEDNYRTAQMDKLRQQIRVANLQNFPGALSEKELDTVEAFVSAMTERSPAEISDLLRRLKRKEELTLINNGYAVKPIKDKNGRVIRKEYSHEDTSFPLYQRTDSPYNIKPKA